MNICSQYVRELNKKLKGHIVSLLLFALTNWGLSKQMQSAKCKAQSVGTALQL